MTHSAKICWLFDAGMVPYARAFQLQQQLVEARKVGRVPDVLIFCEHPPVITLGRNGKRENLKASKHLLAQMNVSFAETDRGGDITYHGPGQIVGYPILDLTQYRRDVRWYVCQLEETMIRTSADYGLSAYRVEGRHGIWIDAADGEEKLAALGVHLSRWVTSHGFAYNVSTDLRYFDLIVPCGITGKRATSLERALDRPVSAAETRSRLAAHFEHVFGCTLRPVSYDQIEQALTLHPDLNTGVEKAVAVEPELAKY